MVRILVAEDSLTQAVQIRGLLEAAGHHVEVAHNGRAALDVLAAQPAAAVLTDLDMPEMNGLDLVHAIRRDYPHIPVILMTAFGSEQIAVQALQSGAASYVPKKNLARDLVETLQDVLDVARAGREEAQLTGFLTAVEARFTLPTVAPPVMSVVGYVQVAMTDLHVGDETDRVRLGVALDTAIHNILYYGALELTPEQLQAAYHLEDGGQSYYRMLEERGREPRFANRGLQVEIRLTKVEVRVTISYQGPGAAKSLFETADSAELEGDLGRGWLLVKSFLDEVAFNSAGNEVVLIRRFDK